MRRYYNRIATHPLIIGSSIMVIGSLAGNVFNFLFNVYMVRLLTIVDYGILASLISLITLPTLAAGAIIPTVVNFAGSFFAKNKIGEASGLFFKISKYFIILGGVFVLLFIIFSQNLSKFLHIPNTTYIVIAGFCVFFGFIGAVNTAFLQAQLAFKSIVGINFIGALTKLLLGLIFVYIGLSIGGVIWAVFISFSLPYILSLYKLRELWVRQIVRIDTPNLHIISYGIPAAICIFSLTSFISSDILLVKHFFSPQEAGIYASLSLIGRIIFFISGPITSVMFPLIVQRHSKNEKYNHIFFLSLAFVTVSSVFITLIYFLFPSYIFLIFFKQPPQLSEVNILGYFGVFISLYSILSLVASYFLSIRKTGIFYILSIGAIIQVVLISLFHSNFLQVIYYSSLVICLLLILLLLYYFQINHKLKNEAS
jgi:O-antigen/teichoic acid export membrane protein